MTKRVPPIARIRLARSLPRLLALPLLGVVAGVGVAATGLLLVPGGPGLGLAAVGGVVMLVSAVAALILRGIHLDVEEAAVAVRWFGGEHTYELVPGPVTRVRLRGENASRLRARRWNAFWQLGPAVLREDEPIEVARLARTRTAILVPTQRGRLAIAAADEDELLEALTRAAQARQRLDAIAPPGPRPDEPGPDLDAPPESGTEPTTTAEIDPALMTGIERAIYERRVAEELEAQERAAREQAEAERRAAEEREAAMRPPEAAPALGSTVATEVPPGRRRLRVTRPAWIRRPAPSVALVALPLIGAAAAWGIGLARESIPPPGTDLGRLTALGLVLAGPGAAVAAIMARIWWPRLVAVVVATGLASAVFVGRVLLG
ncbi:MAG: hypothetical protein K5924_09640 [Chloroflexi bacterium]|nr:hypothetical protein [Chloroflexota bacterium]